MAGSTQEQDVAMLRAEIEMLMTERHALLRTTGAAAIFVAKLDSHDAFLGSDQRQDFVHRIEQYPVPLFIKCGY